MIWSYFHYRKRIALISTFIALAEVTLDATVKAILTSYVVVPVIAAIFILVEAATGNLDVPAALTLL
ncbi:MULTISPECIES: hypothetical protein [Peribacillus]|uniref:hypothetical protein n=1 Tax=Peribacillus TaxID=2675229 RepID=UPI0013A5BE60|nr:hypothetical protein [Peribacillus frigoritolerans]MEC0347707.1 hypothetical protein [Peribacillus castrilensis]